MMSINCAVKMSYQIQVNTTSGVIKVSDADPVHNRRKSCTAFTALNLFWRQDILLNSTELCNDTTKKLVAEETVLVAN